jgi:ribosomal protein RSM22 (predicted rRNA methylase)
MSNLPVDLKEAVLEEIKKIPLALLLSSRQEIGARYREETKRKAIAKSGERFLNTLEDRLAYLATRMPATYAVIRKAVNEIKLRLPHLQVESLLDLGSGPGTALWAFEEVFPSLKRVTLIEQDEHMIELGKRLCLKSKSSLFREVNWQHANLLNLTHLDPHECVVFSYSIGELPIENQTKLIELGWKAAKKALIVIEPGTPYGFKAILNAREHLIHLGAHIAAPCPHANKCPLEDTEDWCHFSERLERTFEHRFLKEGQLGYEDEKYSYVVATREKSLSNFDRILRHPQKRTGHIYLTLCTSEGLKKKIVSKKEGEAYKQAKKLEWGDIFKTTDGP